MNDTFFVYPASNGTECLDDRPDFRNEPPPLGFREYPQTPQHREPLCCGEIASALLINEDLGVDLLGKDNRFPFAGMKYSGKLGNCHAVRHGLPMDPSSLRDFHSAWSPLPSDHEFHVYGIRDDQRSDDLTQKR